MNFVVKQALKSKTGGITDKLDEVTKKCKDIMDSDSDVKTTTVQTLSKEEQIKQEVCFSLNFTLTVVQLRNRPVWGFG